MITNPIHTRSAHLIWQSPPEGSGSRRRLPVALLRDVDGKVTFEYLRETEEFAIAQREGFNGYFGIPLDREDTSDAIRTLGRRLPNPERSDYADYLARFGLSPEQRLPTLSLLAYTGARMTSDSFSFADTFEGFDRPFEYIFDVAGRRHYQAETPEPMFGEPVEFRHEPSNVEDCDAVEILNASGDRFGYVNRSQAKSVCEWLQNGSVRGTVFRVNGTPSHPRLFVKANIIPK